MLSLAELEALREFVQSNWDKETSEVDYTLLDTLIARND